MKLQDYALNKPVLETKRLVLRPLQKEDVADFCICQRAGNQLRFPALFNPYKSARAAQFPSILPYMCCMD